MEWLSYDFKNEVSKGSWKPISLNRGGMGISHIFFADDLTLFGEATKRQARVMMDCMCRFSTMSRLDINLGKSQIFYT